MEDENKIHPVVKLMLARMESHPEEFVSAGRWVEVMNYLDAASRPERSLISAGYRKLILARAHEVAMDELCNGEDHRKQGVYSALGNASTTYSNTVFDVKEVTPAPSKKWWQL